MTPLGPFGGPRTDRIRVRTAVLAGGDDWRKLVKRWLLLRVAVRVLADDGDFAFFPGNEEGGGDEYGTVGTAE